MAKYATYITTVALLYAFATSVYNLSCFGGVVTVMATMYQPRYGYDAIK